MGTASCPPSSSWRRPPRVSETLIQRQPGIRIGVIVADDVTLIYSPTPLLIEAEPATPTAPNAIRLDHAPQRIVDEVGHGDGGVRAQTVGLDKATAADVGKVEADLKANPPQPFDITRKVRVFNAAFEFVDFELSGTSIDQMTVPIPSIFTGLPTNKHANSSARLSSWSRQATSASGHQHHAGPDGRGRSSGGVAGSQTAAGGFKLLAFGLVATLFHPVFTDRLGVALLPERPAAAGCNPCNPSATGPTRL